MRPSNKTRAYTVQERGQVYVCFPFPNSLNVESRRPLIEQEPLAFTNYKFGNRKGLITIVTAAAIFARAGQVHPERTPGQFGAI